MFTRKKLHDKFCRVAAQIIAGSMARMQTAERRDAASSNKTRSLKQTQTLGTATIYLTTICTATLYATEKIMRTVCGLVRWLNTQRKVCVDDSKHKD